MLDFIVDEGGAWADTAEIRASIDDARDPPRPESVRPPRAAIRSDDALLRLRLQRAFGVVAEPSAEVLIVDLRAGDRPPADIDCERPLLALTDDAALHRDGSIAGVLPRDAATRQIRAAAAALVEGLQVRVADRAPDEGVDGDLPAAPAPRPVLTPRERQVLGLVGEGLSNKTIARRLAISAHTVKYHLEAIYAKLGARSRAEAVSRGLRQGLVA